jgi:uncharacterized protein (TIGR02270 family)
VNVPLLNHDVLRVHAEDAAFLVRLREKAVEASNYRIIDLYDLENRLQGHLDAVAMAGEVGIRFAREQLEQETGPGECFVAAHVALRTGRDEMLGPILEAASAAPDFLPSFASAAAWCDVKCISRHMKNWITCGDERFVEIALEVCSAYRADPGEYLDQFVRHGSGRIRARAWRLAGECGRSDLVGRIVPAVREDGPDALEAAWAGCLLGDRGAAPRRLADAVASGLLSPAVARRASELTPLSLLEAEAMHWIRELLVQPATVRWGIVALGTMGRADALPWLCSRMTDPLTARVAGSAFEKITGVHLGLDDLELDEFPEDPPNPAVDDDLTEAFLESVSPWPDPERMRTWLEANGSRFNSVARYLFGIPASSHANPPDPTLKYQARLRAVSLEIALRSPQASLPNWRSRVFLRSGNFVRAW